jgi:hypothetical protein
MDSLASQPPEHDEPAKASSTEVRSFAQRRAYLRGTFSRPGHDGLNRHLAIDDRLKHDEAEMKYWAGAKAAPLPCPFALPEPEPDRSFVLGLLSTFESWYSRWPAALRQQPQRSILLCAAGQAKLAAALAQRHPGAWTVIHPDRRVTGHLKTARLVDPMVRDRARLLAGIKGCAAADPRFLAELAGEKLRVRTGPIERTGLPAACCELVVIDQAHLSADLQSVYAEARRLLRRGGMIIVTGRMPVLADGPIDDLVWEMIELLRPVFTKHDRWLLNSFRTEAFPFQPHPAHRLRTEQKKLLWRTDAPWRCTAKWNLATFAAQIEAWPARRRLEELGSHRAFAVMEILQQIEAEWEKASVKRVVNVPIIARIGVKC